MAVINIPKDNIPLKAYLRADPYSQHFKFINSQDELVTPEMFWGSANTKGLYLDYSHINNRSLQITEGLSEINPTQTQHNKDCNNWIDDNLLNPEITRLFVIQGYAGCGKSTFINHIMNKHTGIKFFYVDIGNDWAYPQEPYMFFNESLKAFDVLIEEIVISTKSRNKIWRKFMELGSDNNISSLDIELLNIFADFENIIEQNIVNIDKGSFRPQLHIVRVIYNHIKYFNHIKYYFYSSNIINKNKMCECLTSWIEQYLKLYKQYFYSILDNTLCYSDNNVYNELWKLLEKQKSHYRLNGDYKNINISISKKHK